MRDYGKVHTSFWTSDDLRTLTGDARLLALYLLTGPHTTQIGCFRVPDGYVMEDLGWDLSKVAAVFDLLSQSGFVVRDAVSKWVLLPKFLKWNAIENPNQGKAAKRLFEQVPAGSGLKAQLVEAVRANVNPEHLTVEFEPPKPSAPSQENGSGRVDQTLDQTLSKPRTRTGTTTVTELSRGGADAPPALQLISSPAASAPDVEYYRRGKDILGASQGAMLKKLLTAQGDNFALARAALETASTKADPKAYIGGIIKSREKASDLEQLRLRGEAW